MSDATSNTSTRSIDPKQRFIDTRGYWTEWREQLLQISPELFEAYVQFAEVPWIDNHLDAKSKELIYIAVNASTHHLFEPSLRIHIRNALRCGATKEEIIEVYELISLFGMHTCAMGVPVLLEVMEERGSPIDTSDLSADQERLKSEFIGIKGYWTHWRSGLLKLSPSLFKAYSDLATVPWKKGHLDPAIKELCYVAVNAATTHLYEPGLKIHIRNALDYGATFEQVMEVFGIVSLLGMHTCAVGIPALIEEIENLQAESEPG